MKFADWAALGGLIAVAIGLLAQALVTAWHFGRFRQRQDTHGEKIDALEEAQKERVASDVSLASKMGEIGANIVHLMGDVATLKRDGH